MVRATCFILKESQIKALRDEEIRAWNFCQTDIRRQRTAVTSENRHHRRASADLARVRRDRLQSMAPT